MMMGQARAWIASIALAIAILERRAVLAQPHEVFPVPATTDALSLVLYVKSSVGDAHFVAVPSSAKAVPTTVTADDVVNPSLHEVFTHAVAKNGSFPVRASSRSAYVIDGLASGQAYDVFFVIEAAKSNGLFSPVGRVLGVSTNGDAPTISSLTVVPVDARTNATEMLLSMDAPSVPCRVWYTILPLRDTVHLGVERFSAQEIAEVAQPDSIIDLPQGLKGLRSPHPINDGLTSDTWYQVSAISERAEGVFCEPVYAVVKTHREPARVMEMVAKPVQGSTDSLVLLVKLDCSSAPTDEACGLLSYRVTETPPPGSPDHVKPRQVAQGTVSIADGRATSHVIPRLSPGKAYAVIAAVETPGSNGALGPTFEVAATTFPRAPNILSVEAARSDAETSTVVVRYKISEPGVIHVSLVERVGHPLAMMAAMIGNQHGVSFSREVGMTGTGGDGRDGSEGSETAVILEGSEEVHGLTAGSAFDVMARTESTLTGRRSSVYGESTSRVVEAVPPIISRLRLSPPDATTTELLLEYEVLVTAGRIHYAVLEVQAATVNGKDSPTKSAEMVKSAVQGQAGVVAAGSTFVSPGRGSSEIGSSNNLYNDGEITAQTVRFRGLQPRKRYVVAVCTESNSGTLSKVFTEEAEVHAEAPLVAESMARPADRSAEALSLVVTLESAGLVHLVVRRAQELAMAIRDHTIVYKATLEANTTSLSSPHVPPVAGAGVITAKAGEGGVTVTETVDGLEPNATYEVFIATETIDSNGVYRADCEPVLATTHALPSSLEDAHARAADASSSALIVTVSLATLAEIHYAVFEAQPGDRSVDALASERPRKETLSEEEGRASMDKGGGEEEYHWRGCGHATIANKGPTALNDTIGLAASGMVPSAASAAFLLSEEGEKPAPPAKVAPTNLLAVTQGGFEVQSHLTWDPSGVEGVKVVFRVDGLQAAKAYDICLFTETPGSNGLFGEVHELRGISTHAPVPELVSERVACTVDCSGLNRDSCWLEANKCGECSEGFVGKAGHVNSPCGKVSSLTVEDLARIAERELEESGRRKAESLSFPQGSLESLSVAGLQDPEIETTHERSTGGPNSAMRTRDGSVGGPLMTSRLLLGVPFVAGPNITKFVYVEVPETDANGEQHQKQAPGGGARDKGRSFDPEEAAARLCTNRVKEGDELRACLSTLTAVLTSRFSDGLFHREDDPERPLLQVEVDTPNGESLAFTLRHGEQEGAAIVAFCRDNQADFPDEQACVIALMQELHS